MFPQKRPISASIDSKTYPLGENREPIDPGHALALVALSHTPVEHRLYSAMLDVPANGAKAEPFTVRRLMTLAGITSLSTVRRSLEGLVAKLSIERISRQNDNGKREQAIAYRAFAPEEIVARRKQHNNDNGSARSSHAFERALARVAENVMLSRREAQVALCCVEGLTNAEIGNRLQVSEQTVKFHLRHIFIKFGVKRRAELISRLLR